MTRHFITSTLIRDSGNGKHWIVPTLFLQLQPHCDSGAAYHNTRASQAASGKEPACQCRRHKRRGLNPWVRKIPWRRAWQPTPVFLPGESHGQRSLVGYSPWGCKESDTTDVTEHACTHHNIFIYPKFWFHTLTLSFHSPDHNTVHFAPQLDNPPKIFHYPLPLNINCIIQSWTSYQRSIEDFLTLKLVVLFSHNPNRWNKITSLCETHLISLLSSASLALNSSRLA